MDQSICLRYNCSVCCNPVKVRRFFGDVVDIDKLPFKKRNELLAPEDNLDLRLESYDCKWFDKRTGKCKHYHQRPAICRHTKCSAFETDDPREQKKIIEQIKRKKFLKIYIFDPELQFTQQVVSSKE